MLLQKYDWLKQKRSNEPRTSDWGTVQWKYRKWSESRGDREVCEEWSVSRRFGREVCEEWPVSRRRSREVCEEWSVSRRCGREVCEEWPISGSRYGRGVCEG